MGGVGSEEEIEKATLFLDAKNAFPNMEKCNALARVRVDWPEAAMTVYNGYRGAHLCFGGVQTLRRHFGHGWKKERKWAAPWQWEFTG